MYVSAKLDYALRSLALLAAEAGRAPMTAAHLAGRQGLSTPYVAAILAELRREGLLVNQRGPNGGFRLARCPEQISVGDVVAALRIWPVDGHAAPGGPDEVGDRLAALWQQVGHATNELLAAVTIADVAVASGSVGGTAAGPAPTRALS